MTRILCGICLLFVFFSCKTSPSGSPTGAVKAFIDAARNGDVTQLKKYISKSDVSMLEIGENMLSRFDPDGSKGMKDKFFRELHAKTKDAKIEVKNEHVDGDKATVDVTYSEPGKSETRPVHLVKEDGQWKVSLLTTGMQNSGANEEDMQDAMKQLSSDSLQQAIGQAMQELNSVNGDSMKAAVAEAMKAYDRIDKDSLRRAIAAGVKSLNARSRDSINKAIDDAMKEVDKLRRSQEKN